MKKNVTCCDLKTCFLCKGSLPDWMPAVAAQKQNLRVKKGAVIFEEGSAVTGLYFIYTGAVKVHTRWGQEKQLILYFASGGDMIGYRGLGDDRVYPVTATALEDTVLCFVDISFFEATLEVNHQLTYSLMKFYANELQVAERRMRNLAHMEVKGRVAETLLMLRHKFGNKEGFIDIALTKQDLASYAGTTYETFSRTVSELAKEGLIEFSGKKVSIINEEKLVTFTSTN